MWPPASLPSAMSHRIILQTNYSSAANNERRYRVVQRSPDRETSDLAPVFPDTFEFLDGEPCELPRGLLPARASRRKIIAATDGTFYARFRDSWRRSSDLQSTG